MSAVITTFPTQPQDDSTIEGWLIQLKLRLRANDAEPIRFSNFTNYDAVTQNLRLETEVNFIRDNYVTVLRPYFARERALAAWKSYDKRLEQVSTSADSLSARVSFANATIHELLADKITQAAIRSQLSEQHALDDSQAALDAYSTYTYLLKVGGKVVVLTDEEAKHRYLKLPGKPARQYSIISAPDAKLEARGIQFSKTNDKGQLVKANIFDAWADSPTRVELSGITCNPSTSNRVVNGQFNIWRGFRDWAALVPDGETISGADAAFWELVREVICDDNPAYFDFVQKYLAHLVQRPFERPLCAIGVSGPQGCGKSMFVSVVGGLLDPIHYNSQVQMSALLGSAMGRDLEGILVAYLDEATWGGSKEGEGAIKKAITGEIDEINEKFVPKYAVPTYKRIFFSSNESYYYHADADDRRLLPLEVSKTKPKRSYEFFAKIKNKQELIPRVQAAILQTLRNIDISDFVPHQALSGLQITTGSVMQERSMSSISRWLKYSLNEGAFEVPRVGDRRSEDYVDRLRPEDGISIPDLRASYSFYCSHSSFDDKRKLNLSEGEGRQALEDTFGCKPKSVRSASGRVISGYKVALETLRDNFSDNHKWEIVWDART